MYKNINSPLCFVLDGSVTERNVRSGIRPGTVQLRGTFCGEFGFGPPCQTETPETSRPAQSKTLLRPDADESQDAGG